MEIPAPKAHLVHSIDIQPRFNDYDLFGHLNNGAVLQYFDLGKSEFLGDILAETTGDADRFDPEAVSAVIVNINADFYAVTLPGEPLSVLTGVQHIGDRSFTLEQRLINPDSGHVKAIATTIMAGIDISTQTGAPLKPTLKTALLSRM